MVTDTLHAGDVSMHSQVISSHGIGCYRIFSYTLQWCQNERQGVSCHRRLDWLIKPLFRRRSKKISKLRITGLCEENPPGNSDSSRKGPVTQKMFPFDGVVMTSDISWWRNDISFKLIYMCFLNVKWSNSQMLQNHSDVTRMLGLFKSRATRAFVQQLV